MFITIGKFKAISFLCRGHNSVTQSCTVLKSMLVDKVHLVRLLTLWCCSIKIPETGLFYKEQKFVAHSSGGWNVQDQGPNRSDYLMGTVLCVLLYILWRGRAQYPHTVKQESHKIAKCWVRVLPETSFLRALIPLMRSPHDLITS